MSQRYIDAQMHQRTWVVAEHMAGQGKCTHLVHKTTPDSIAVDRQLRVLLRPASISF